VRELQRLREVEQQYRRLQTKHDLLKKAIRFVADLKQKSLHSSRQTGTLPANCASTAWQWVARLMRLARLQGRSARLYRRSRVSQRAFFTSIANSQRAVALASLNQI